MTSSIAIDQLRGPSGLPLLGNALQLDLPRLHLVLEEWAAQYGSIYGLHIGRKPVVVISDAGLIQQILRDRPETFRRFQAIETVFAELAPSLFSLEGETWKRHRRVWMQALNIHQVKPFFADLVALSQLLKKKWDQDALTGRPVDIQQDFVSYTFDAMIRFAFAYDSRTIETGSDEVQQRIKRSLDHVGRRVNAPIPYWRWIKLPADRRLDRDVTALREFVAERIDAARVRLTADADRAQQPANLIEALLIARDEDGSAFSTEEIFGAALSSLGAGVDTTANTLSWMAFYIAQRSDVQARLQREVSDVLGDATVWSDYVQGERLAYADAVMAEAMRLKPVAPIFFMAANADIELGGVKLPAGTDLMLLTRPAAVAETEFPDPLAFKPERWMDASQSLYTRRPPTPFGSGPRMCPGRNLAQLEIKAAISLLARNYTIKLPEGSPTVVEEFGFSMMPKGLQVHLSRA
jgi:cytochrome P450